MCHGPAALVDMTLSDGSYLIAGKQVTGFTNGEEQNLGRYPWLRRSNRREIEIETGEMPGASPASRLREILVFVRKPAAFDEQESLAQLLQLEMSMAMLRSEAHCLSTAMSWSTPSGSRSTNGSPRIRNSGSLTSAMDQRKTLFHAERETGGPAVAVRPKSHKFKHRADWEARAVGRTITV